MVSVATWYPLSPLVVHSTSWRYVDGSVVLTYLLVCEPPERLPRESLDFRTVGRTELARGDATTPPISIGVDAVLEHALRHLAWLLKDDAAIAAALPSWADLLRRYPPEPFRAL